MTDFLHPPRNLIIPLEICSLILTPSAEENELNFLEIPNQAQISQKKILIKKIKKGLWQSITRKN